MRPRSVGQSICYITTVFIMFAVIEQAPRMLGGKFLTFFKGLWKLAQFQKIVKAFEYTMRHGNENHVSIS